MKDQDQKIFKHVKADKGNPLATRLFLSFYLHFICLFIRFLHLCTTVLL